MGKSRLRNRGHTSSAGSTGVAPSAPVGHTWSLVASDIISPPPPGGRRHTAYWLLLTVLLGLPLITPLLRWSSVACTHDGHLHYHRVAAMAHAWNNGIQEAFLSLPKFSWESAGGATCNAPQPVSASGN